MIFLSVKYPVMLLRALGARFPDKVALTIFHLLTQLNPQ